VAVDAKEHEMRSGEAMLVGAVLALSGASGCAVEEGSGGSCDDLAMCTGGDVCADGTCVPAFPRDYYVFAAEAAIEPYDPATGTAWDPLGGAPDTVADIYVNDEYVFSTEEVADTLSPVWNELVGPIQLQAGDSLGIYVFDMDLDEADYVGGCLYAPLTAVDVRAGLLGCGGEFGFIDWAISP
jgi:hypothetical protein